MVRRDIWLRTFTLVAVESGIVVSAVLLSLYLRFASQYHSVLFEQRGIYKIAFTAFICQSVFYLFDLYDISAARPRRELLANIIQAVGVACLIMGLVALLRPTLLLGYLQQAEGSEGGVRYANGVPTMAMVIALALMICWRVAIHWVLSHPRLGERILIVGTGAPAVELAREALARRDLGYRIIGFITEDPAQVGQSLFNPSVIGTVDDLNTIVGRERVDRVVVALDDRRGHLPVDHLLKLRLQGSVVIEEGTALYERVTGKISVEMLRPSWIIFSGGGRRGPLYYGVRRALNLTAAVIGMLLSLPVALLTAVAIKLESPGPVFYQQERVGKNGRLFTIIKFRSMRQDAEKEGPVWAAAEDDRTTLVGRFIRKVRIDEIPQFINILRGEMSFVGPRPERPFFVEQLGQLIPFYSQRHLVEPGLTGWAQVMYPYGASVEDALQKLQYDLYYIKNASLFFDLWVLFKSFKIILFGRGR